MAAKTIFGKILNNVTGGLSQQIGKPIYDAIRGTTPKPSLNATFPAQVNPSAITPGVTNPQSSPAMLDNVKNEGLNPLWLLGALVAVLYFKSRGR